MRVQLLPTLHPRNRHQKVPPRVTHQPFHLPLVVALARTSELLLKQIVALQFRERPRLLPLSASQNLRHRQLRVVVENLPRHSPEISKGAHVARMTKQQIRCAVYTRKSSEEGLEQSFNSLEAQREACMAYINSQKHEGWVAASGRYDDGGFSGGTMERPALKQLLDHIAAGKIATVIVYKVDRLTRSLAYFAKIIEVFDSHNVSFVSVTQQFHTTTSMGRLTLNVLLSFAQFEREVTGERIRDKIAASKRKGLWVGGNLPLGYEMKDGKIAIIEEEAELVRSIFRRYLELDSVNELVRDLKERNIRTKSRLLSTGATRGGIPFGRGALYYLLGNHFYIGEVKYKNEILPGEQPPIMDRALFDVVRQKSLAQWSHRTIVRNKSDHLLTGLLFDDAGHRMVPTHATKAGLRYRYYVSTQCLHGEAKTALAGSVSRIPAADIEDVVVKFLKKYLAAKQDKSATSVVPLNNCDAVTQLVAGIIVHKDTLIVRLKLDNE